MIEFDLEKVKAGKKVMTRLGRNARFLCDNLKNYRYPLCFAVENDGCEDAFTYTKEGHYRVGECNDEDLFMAPEKREGWINIYKNLPKINERTAGTIFPTEEAAMNACKFDEYITTVKIEWEE